MAKILSKAKKILDESNAGLAEDAVRWSSLVKDVGLKSALETYLAVHVAEVSYKTDKSRKQRLVICTANQRLIGVFKALKEGDKKKLAAGDPSIGIHTRDSLTVTVYNLIEGHLEDIQLNSVSVSPASISLLNTSAEQLMIIDAALKKCLKLKALK